MDVTILLSAIAIMASAVAFMYKVSKRSDNRLIDTLSARLDALETHHEKAVKRIAQLEEWRVTELGRIVERSERSVGVLAAAVREIAANTNSLTLAINEIKHIKSTQTPLPEIHPAAEMDSDYYRNPK